MYDSCGPFTIHFVHLVSNQKTADIRDPWWCEQAYMAVWLGFLVVYLLAHQLLQMCLVCSINHNASYCQFLQCPAEIILTGDTDQTTL